MFMDTYTGFVKKGKGRAATRPSVAYRTFKNQSQVVTEQKVV